MSISVLYVGRHWNDQFLTQLIFGNYEELYSGRARLTGARVQRDRLKSQADVEIVDIGWPYNKWFGRDSAYLEVPDWINMELPIADEWDDVILTLRNTTRNNDLRLIRRNEYKCKVTHDAQAVEVFYDEMYVPTITRRHGATSILAPRKHVVKRAQRGALLQIWRRHELVIAGVIYPEDQVLHFLWQGLAPKFQGQPPEGAVSALYYYGIRHAFDNNIGTVDFAGTRAFLDFGDFRFKRKWGAHVDDSFSPSSLLIRPLSSRDATLSFCERFPVIERTTDGLQAMLVANDADIGDSMLERLHKQYYCEGLTRTVVVNLTNQHDTRVRDVEVKGHEYRIVDCSIDEFCGRYVSH